ncbi:thioredoxin-disulfide reductase [Desulfoluna sp.]|uniref:thioredoxin-disulfide reductase n=1 Tax=Desulfoluna sp. TaxID=2045199 RepID=UPI00260DC0CE|nr:thioredoxin-disulfide reductase [Desulfoluna sp.]
MAETHYDLIIIGGGPAGLTAGMYASRARLNTVLVEKVATGGQILITDWIENYPGFPEGISGPDLSDKMLEQARQFDLQFEYGEVEKVELEGAVKSITIGDKVLTAKAVIITTGASPRSLHVGEEKFHGKGVSYCATCDGPFYKDKTVVAVGGGDTAVQESLYLTKFAKKVHLVHRRDQLRAAKILQERALANDKIDMVWDSVVTGMDGLFGVENVTVKNVKTNEETKIAAAGCFIWIGILPNTDFLGNALEMDEWNFIKADANMATSIPGVFAAGDVRSTPLRQIATAVGDSAIAAISAEHYIEGH